MIDRARRIAVVVHALEHSLHPLGAGAVNRNPRMTGRTCPSSRYRARHDRPKVVRFWAMRPLGGEFRPHDEVDDVRWLPLPEAGAALTYERDRAVLAALADAVR